MAKRIFVSEQERDLLRAVVGLVLQYLTVTNDQTEFLDTQNMSAGEHALKVLESYGLVETEGLYRSAEWTAKGRQFLEQEF